MFKDRVLKVIHQTGQTEHSIHFLSHHLINGRIPETLCPDETLA